jgi:hypothetical protein
MRNHDRTAASAAHKDLMTLLEAAAYLHTRERHMRRLQEVIPHMKLGGRVVFDVADLNAYLDSRRVEPRRWCS